MSLCPGSVAQVVGAERHLDVLAQSQHGLVTRSQAVELSISSARIGHRLRSGRWQSIHPGVYRLPGTPRTLQQRILGACLAAGPSAMASHRSAGWLWGLLDTGLVVVEVSIAYGHHRRIKGASLHQFRDTCPRPVRHKAHIPLTDPLLTLFDLAGVLRFHHLEHAVDAGIASRLVTLAGLRAEVQRRQARGRRGGPALRAILQGRGVLPGPPPSVLESRMYRLLCRHDLAPPVRELPVASRGHHYRLDFAYPEAGLAVETDGYEHHATPQARDEDAARQNNLVLAGWRVLRYTWGDLTREPEYVARQVRQALMSGRHPLPSSVDGSDPRPIDGLSTP